MLNWRDIAKKRPLKGIGFNKGGTAYDTKENKA